MHSGHILVKITFIFPYYAFSFSYTIICNQISKITFNISKYQFIDTKCALKRIFCCSCSYCIHIFVVCRNASWFWSREAEAKWPLFWATHLSCFIDHRGLLLQVFWYLTSNFTLRQICETTTTNKKNNLTKVLLWKYI